MNPSDLVAAIKDWMGPARWHLGESTDLAPAGLVPLERWDGGAVVWLVVVDGKTAYNVPLVIEEAQRSVPAPVGSVGASAIYDAAEHPRGQKAILGLVNGANVEAGELSIAGAPLAMPDSPIASAHKLTSEQSNTSVIYELENGKKLIAKIFRVLASGHNPDVELQQALDGTGTVARQYGSATLVSDSGAREDFDSADILVVQEFLEGAVDAWQVITDQLGSTDGTLGPLADSIRSLGALTRTIHTELAKAFPVVPASRDRQQAIETAWDSRAQAALELVPELNKDAIDAAYEAATQVDWPDLQRIHGDYHLGQVLEVPGRGWFALDFEGEPLRPLAERTGPDLALRDVAGMLRSFDYAAGSAELAGGDPDTLHAWAEAASAAFMAGYGQLDEAEETLLRSLIIDKALYEVSYEAHERPSWLQVPVAGLERLLRHVS